MGKHFWLILGVLLLAGAAVEIWWSNYGISVSSYNVRSAEIPEGFEGYKIVQLSDLHSATIGKKNSRLLDTIYAENPNIIVMTGDMVSRFDTDFSVTTALIGELVARYPVYYIQGNHEEGLEKDTWYDLKDTFREMGVTVLDNERIELTDGAGGAINLVGLWYNLNYYHQMANYYTPFTQDIIDKILGKAPEGYTILLAHNPNYFDVYADWGADLSLSGHIHGGMIRLPLIGGILSPETLLFPKYDAGVFENGSAKMILSRGLGRGRMGIRLFNPPEVVSITLHSGEEGGK